MRKYIENLLNFENVASGKTAKSQATIGPRYHKITLDYKENGSRVNQATMEASIEEIVVKLNKVEQWRIDPASLFAMETSYNPNFAVDDGLIHLYFTDRTQTGQLSQERTAIGTLGVDSLSVEVKIKSGLATTPSLDAYAEVDDVSEAPGIIRKVMKDTLIVNATGSRKVNLTRRGAQWRALHFFETADGDVTNIRFKHEKTSYVDHDTDVLHAMLREYGYTAAAKQIFLPFERGFIADALPSQVEQKNSLLRDASTLIDLTMGAANNVDMVEDFYSTPDV